MKYKLLLLLAISLSTLLSCENEPININNKITIEIDDVNKTQILFSSIEYDLYMAEKERAQLHTSHLKYKISSCDNNYCEEDSEAVQRLINDLKIYTDKISQEGTDWSLEKLRDLKAQFIRIQKADDYDPYLYNLWRFEEEMYYTTKAAIDPKLDLYEWGEFKMMVDCMNEDWQIVKLHYPSAELFGNNQLGHKIQTKAKINLQETINQFNKAVESDDYIKYNLCDSGLKLREGYIRYLKTFVDQEIELEPFFATL